MEIKKGIIREIGACETTKNGTNLVHLGIQIGVDKTFNRYTGAEEQMPEMVDYTLWHDEARAASQLYGVGDEVELEMSHFIDRQWKRTVTSLRNLKVTRKAGVPTTQEMLMERQAQKAAAQQAAGIPAGDGERLPW